MWRSQTRSVDPFQIKKHSSLIQIQSQLSLNQRKMINGLIFLIKERLKADSSQRLFMIELGVLKKVSGIKKSDNTKLKQSLQSLAAIKIEYNILWKDKSKRWIFSLFSHVEIMVEEKGKRCQVKIECPTIVLDSIKHPNMYSLLNMWIIKKFRSKHSLILYEVLFDYKGINSIYIDIANLKKLFWINQSQYSNWYSMFQKRVLDLAIGEINKVSDLSINISTLHRIGRKVIGYTFDIKQLSGTSEDEKTQELFYRLRKHWISSKESSRLIWQFSETTIFNNLNYVQGQVSKWVRINSLAWLTVHAIKNNTSDSISDNLPIEMKNVEQNEVLKTTKEDFHLHCQSILSERLSNLNWDNHKELFNKYIDWLPKEHFAYKYVQRNEVNHPLVLSCFNKHLLNKFLSLEELDFERFKDHSKE